VKIVTGYVRVNRAAHVLRALQKATVPGLTAYAVCGTKAANPPSSHELHPLKQTNVPESVKIEVICDDGFSDRIVRCIAQAVKTDCPDDIAVGVEAFKIPHIRNVVVLDFRLGENT
jgi:nitrogen regulatory protein PII